MHQALSGKPGWGWGNLEKTERDGKRRFTSKKEGAVMAGVH